MSPRGLTAFFSLRTLWELVKYGAVSLGEFGAGWFLLNVLRVNSTLFVAYLVSQTVIGFAGFVVRKLWVFKTNSRSERRED